jgi:hypothetical protein
MYIIKWQGLNKKEKYLLRENKLVWFQYKRVRRDTQSFKFNLVILNITDD